LLILVICRRFRHNFQHRYYLHQGGYVFIGVS